MVLFLIVDIIYHIGDFCDGICKCAVSFSPTIPIGECHFRCDINLYVNKYNESWGNRENDALIFLVFTDFGSGRGYFPGVSLRSTLGYYKSYAFPCFARLPHKITTEPLLFHCTNFSYCACFTIKNCIRWRLSISKD